MLPRCWSCIAAWFLAARLQLVDPLFLPGPIEVADHRRAADRAKATGRCRCGCTSWSASAARCLLSSSAAITGIPIGLLMGRSPIFNAILDPFVQFLRPLPKLALIPLVMVWFGIGEVSKFVLIIYRRF